MCQKITDAGLGHFKACTHMSEVYLEGVGLTDTALALIAGYKDLTGLQLNNTQVTDAGLVHLKDCTKLMRIVLQKFSRDARKGELDPDGKRIPNRLRVELRRLMNLSEWEAVSVVQDPPAREGDPLPIEGPIRQR